jgi:hypothetical protein
MTRIEKENYLTKVYNEYLVPSWKEKNIPISISLEDYIEKEIDKYEELGIW